MHRAAFLASVAWALLGTLSAADGHPALPVPAVMAPRVVLADGAWGSASVVDSSTVLTALHIVAYARAAGIALTVEFPDAPAAAPSPSCETSEPLDLAILQMPVPGYPHDHPVPVDVRVPAVGESVSFAGHARGTRPSRADFTERISTVDYEVPVRTHDGRTVTYPLVAWILSPGMEMNGMSGSPVYDADAELLGVVCCVSFWGGVGFVPLSESLRECPLPGR